MRKSFIFCHIKFSLSLYGHDCIAVTASKIFPDNSSRLVEHWVSGSLRAYNFCGDDDPQVGNPYGSREAARNVFFHEFEEMCRVPY